MIAGRSVLGVIPARGGSRNVPRKNIRLLAGKPLIAWTIQAARQSRYLDRLILTSEDDEIMSVAAAWGCETPFVRPAELSRDDTPGIAPVLHAIQAIGQPYDLVVLLQPTSPLRTADDIDTSLCHCIKAGAPACVSVCAAAQHPCWMHTLDGRGRLCPLSPTGQPIARRQDLPPVYVENGALYIALTDFLLREQNFITAETLAYVMPAERSADIDSDLDFLVCGLLMTRTVPELTDHPAV